MRALAYDELYRTGMKVRYVVLGRRATFDKVEVGIVLDDDERMLELAGSLSV